MKYINMSEFNKGNFEYYLKQKNAYEKNLKNEFGHKESIIMLIKKIDQKLLTINSNYSLNKYAK